MNDGILSLLYSSDTADPSRVYAARGPSSLSRSECELTRSTFRFVFRSFFSANVG